MEEQTKTGSQIKVLEEQVKLMSSKLRTVQSLAGQTSRDATDAYTLPSTYTNRLSPLKFRALTKRTLKSKLTQFRKKPIRSKRMPNG